MRLLINAFLLCSHAVDAHRAWAGLMYFILGAVSAGPCGFANELNPVSPHALDCQRSFKYIIAL